MGGELVLAGGSNGSNPVFDLVDSIAMFSPDGSSVLLDDQGRAAVTVDFVCLRCHNGVGAFEISLPLAADIARDMHASD